LILFGIVSHHFSTVKRTSASFNKKLVPRFDRKIGIVNNLMKGAVKLRRTRRYREGFEPSSAIGFMPVMKHPGVEPIERKKAAL
jgi:hypothetical protein